MSALGERAVRVAVIGIVVGLAVLLGLRVMDYLDKPAEPRTAEVGQGEHTVGDAMLRQPTGAIVVRGYVFANDGFPVRVCNGIQPGSPPECVGPYLELRNLDPSRVPVRKQRRERDGKDVIWSPETVALLGQVDRDRFTVQELVQ